MSGTSLTPPCSSRPATSSHNASAIVEDLEDSAAVGGAVFGRFTGTREQTLGYYHSLSILNARHSPVARAFDATGAKHSSRCALHGPGRLPAN